jgi:hypothetical protein
MPSKLFSILAALGVALIALVTLSSQAARPVLISQDESNLIVFVERFGAYAVLGGLLYLAMPRRIGFALVTTSTIAVMLEALQILRADRDPALLDVIEKVCGGIVGILVCHAALRMLPIFRKAPSDLSRALLNRPARHSEPSRSPDSSRAV